MSTSRNRIRDDLINSGLLKPSSNKLESVSYSKRKGKESKDSAIESRRKELTPKWVKNRDMNKGVK